MNDKLQSLVEKLDNAQGRLREALDQPKNDFLRDSAIQRFEFTFELFWKCLKSYCFVKGIRVHSPRDAIRSAFQLGLLTEDEVWLAMLEDRNRTSHTYDDETAEQIFDQLDRYHGAIVEVLSELKKQLDELS